MIHLPADTVNMSDINELGAAQHDPSEPGLEAEWTTSLDDREIIDPFKLPEILAHSNPTPPMTPGIYFLLMDGVIVYVGKSWEVGRRIATHLSRGAIPFDRWTFCPVEPLDMDLVERFYIGKFKPRYNISHK